jgi:hypothetical protein
MSGCNGDVVEQAETHCPVALGVMAGRPNERERSGSLASPEHVLHRAHRRSRRQTGDLVRLGRGIGVWIEGHRPAGGLSDERDIVGVVNTPDFLVACRARLEHGAATLPELSRHHLHHLETLDALGMAGWGQVIGEAIGREQRERHGK